MNADGGLRLACSLPPKPLYDATGHFPDGHVFPPPSLPRLPAAQYNALFNTGPYVPTDRAMNMYMPLRRLQLVRPWAGPRSNY